jgi:hypothetical protein
VGSHQEEDKKESILGIIIENTSSLTENEQELFCLGKERK